MAKVCKLEWCVWWFEVNNFDGKVSRVYRDFETNEQAQRFRKTQYRKGIWAKSGEIKNLTWHHSHANVIPNPAGKKG